MLARNCPLASRSPCGERGLKYGLCNPRKVDSGSLPVRGAWVEMCPLRRGRGGRPGRSPCGERGLKYGFNPSFFGWAGCRSPCGERGLKCGYRRAGAVLSSRSPCGERGLKCCWSASKRIFQPSLPVRGAWVEISCGASSRRRTSCRSPCGERGLKCRPLGLAFVAVCRSPCGERGLKWRGGVGGRVLARSLPVRGAWVEITTARPHTRTRARRSPCGERGLKSPRTASHLPERCRSPCGERGLKYALGGRRMISARVAPRAGSVG